ncbi:Mor transcription activator family protein [Zestomonas carbonaria]|nr:Mor transcription activator family protein [Pseudomonas carbonaria]
MAEKRHELFTAMFDHMVLVLHRDFLIPKDVAEQAASAVVDHIAVVWGGSHVTIPKDFRWNLTQRDLEILSKFKGNNHRALAAEYNLCENAIYKLLKRIQDRKFARDQHSLDLGDLPTD